MSKKTRADITNDEVRRRVAEILSAAGVDYGRSSLEVLYLLPTEFVRMYTDLFWQGLSEDLSKGDIGGSDEGRVKKKARSEGVQAREMHIGSSGKRFKQHWIVRDEAALEAKRQLDRKIVRAADAAFRAVKTKREEQRDTLNGAAGKKVDEVPDLRNRPSAPKSDTPEIASSLRNWGDGQLRCGECGRIASDSWLRCPFHE